jgi:hypothetical protein
MKIRFTTTYIKIVRVVNNTKIRAFSGSRQIFKFDKFPKIK